MICFAVTVLVWNIFFMLILAQASLSFAMEVGVYAYILSVSSMSS